MRASTTAGRNAKSFAATGRVLLVIIYVLALQLTASCISNGALRLVGGSTAREGTVEICLDSTWGTVCDNFFGQLVARVICRQLGYPASGAVAHRAAHFGHGSGPVHIGNAQCNGTEQTILDCHINYENSCVHSEDAGVECTAPCSPEGSVRLTGGDRPGRGTVWVCINGLWSTICDNFWNIPDARVVCRQLGYGSQGTQAYNSAFYGEGFGPILLDFVQCDGNEAALLDCTYTNHSQCDHSSDAGVSCYIEPSSVYTSPSTLLVSSYLMSTSLWVSSSASNISITPGLATTSVQVTTTFSSQSLTSTEQTPTSSSVSTTQPMSTSTALTSTPSAITTAIPITQTISLVQTTPSSAISESQSIASSVNVTGTLSASLTDSLSRSASMTSLTLTQNSIFSTFSLTVNKSQSKSIATSVAALSTTLTLLTTPLQTPLNTPLKSTPSSISILPSEDLFTFTTAAPTQSSFTPLSLPSLSSASSTPSGGGGSNSGLTLPAIESISIAGGTIAIVLIFLIIVIPCTYRICKKRRTGQAEYDVNSDTKPLTDTQHSVNTVVLDIQSLDGDSVTYEDASSPTTESADELEKREVTEPAVSLSHKQPQPQDPPSSLNDMPPSPELAEKLELRQTQIEAESPKLLSHQEALSSADQRQDLDSDRSSSSVTSSDSQQTPQTSNCEGATGLQEMGDNTSVAEEVEMGKLGDDREEQTSSDREAPLHEKSADEPSDAGEEVELKEMHNLESREPSHKYQKLQ